MKHVVMNGGEGADRKSYEDRLEEKPVEFVSYESEEWPVCPECGRRGQRLVHVAGRKKKLPDKYMHSAQFRAGVIIESDTCLVTDKKKVVAEVPVDEPEEVLA